MAEDNENEVAEALVIPSTRETLEKNMREIPDKPVTEYDGSPDAPAKGKSFVNNEVQGSNRNEPIQAPGDMSPEERRDFERLTPEMQKYQVRRAQDVRRQIGEAHQLRQEVLQVSQQYQDLERVITPEVRDEYARERTSVPQLVENALAWDRAFKSGDKIATAAEYLRAQGVDVNEFLYSYQNGIIGREPEPQYLTQEDFQRQWEAKQLEQQQINTVKQGEVALESFLSNPIFQVDPSISEQRQLAVAKEVRILQEIEGFSGTPQQVLGIALERAVATSEHFSSVRGQQSNGASTNVHQQMQRVRDAKKASRSITGSLGSGSPVQKYSNLRENLLANLAKS